MRGGIQIERHVTAIQDDASCYVLNTYTILDTFQRLVSSLYFRRDTLKLGLFIHGLLGFLFKAQLSFFGL